MGVHIRDHDSGGIKFKKEKMNTSLDAKDFD